MTTRLEISIEVTDMGYINPPPPPRPVKISCGACQGAGLTYPGQYLREEAQPKGAPARTCLLCQGKGFVILSNPPDSRP